MDTLKAFISLNALATGGKSGPAAVALTGRIPRLLNRGERARRPRGPGPDY